MLNLLLEDNKPRPLSVFFTVLAFCALALQYFAHCSETKNPSSAAVSFFVIDLKYNNTQGIQICEIQPGVISKFQGYDFIKNETGAAAENFCNVLSTLHHQLWFVPKCIIDPSFIQTLNEREWNQAKNHKSLEKDQDFIATMTQPVYDPSSIHDYHGILYTRASKLKPLKTFRKKFPGVLVIDGAMSQYGKDKYTMNKLLTDDESLRNIKPKWNLYSKKYSKKLVKKIKKEIGSEAFVIKPRRGTLGHGVIIVSQDKLSKVLKKIMNKPTFGLKRGNDDAYYYWANDKGSSLIVEAFVPSDTIHVPHLDNMPYDPTMRVGVVVAYSEGNIDLHFVACYWKLPKKSLNENGNLSELHKSCGKSPFFCEVSEEVQVKVEQQLSEALPRLFHIMLSGG